MKKINSLIYLIILAILSSCATSNHGSFVPSTHKHINDETVSKNCQKVIGESKQTWFLYIIPIGNAPSTDEAISDAKSKINDTKYLTDLSIDDRTYWKIGYSEQVIETRANACR